MRKGILYLSIAVTSILIAQSYSEILISNLVVAQQSGTKTVALTYDVACDESPTVTVGLSVSNGSVAISSSALTGDVGTGISIGDNRSIYWDAGADWDGNLGDLSYTVTVATEAGDAVVSAVSLPKTGQTASFYAGDDGGLQKGVEWPNPRFTDNENGTVLDNLTGLTWIKSPHALPGNAANMTWRNALNLCNDLTYGGFSDWRMSNVREMESLINYGVERPVDWLNGADTPFSGISGGKYWLSTVYTYISQNAFDISLADGQRSNYGRGWVHAVAWPVRGGGVGYPASVPRTGQTQSYRTGDDGGLKQGVSWPSPRFTNHGDGTTTDHLTGLQWVTAPHDFPGNARVMNWASASYISGEYEYAGHADWRLPNVTELSSLIDYSQSWLQLPSGHPFIGVYMDDYWTSTTSGADTTKAWRVHFRYSIAAVAGKTASTYVWPVRDADPVFFKSDIETTAKLDARDYRLIVESEHGTPLPSTGIYSNYCWGSAVTCSVESAVIESGTNYVCTHWSGTGTVPLNGQTNTTGHIELSEPDSSIVWKWIADDDSDRLDDTWERDAFGDLSQDYQGNKDMDGLENWEEYIAGTDPDDGTSVFAASNTVQEVNGTNGFVLMWNSIPDRMYTARYSTNLNSGFEVLQSGIEYPVNSYTDVVHSVEGARFYVIDVDLK